MAKHSIHFSHSGPVVDDLAIVVRFALLEGVDLTRNGRLSKSKVVCEAIARGARACEAALRQPAPMALPETTSSTDAARVLAARQRAGLSLRDLAVLLGYKDKASVQNVERKGMRLTGALKAWVEEHERAFGL